MCCGKLSLVLPLSSLSVNDTHACLQLRVLHVFRPVVLDGHRLQRVEERVIVQTVHFVRVVLRTHPERLDDRTDQPNHSYTYPIDAVIDVAARRIRFAERLRLVHESPAVQENATGSDGSAQRQRSDANAGNGAHIEDGRALRREYGGQL